MEAKKKKIIPIVIGISVLVVLIVGATFAYFQGTDSASGTTTIEATTKEIGAVIVTNPTESLSMELSAYDMQESMKGAKYYATNDEGVKYLTEEQNHVISKATISGGDEKTIYNCKYKLTITKPSEIVEGDMTLFINGNGAKINGEKSVSTDLYSVSGENSVSYDISFKYEGNGSLDLLRTDITLNNTEAQQNHLIGTTLITTISNSELRCEIEEKSENSICDYDGTSTIAPYEEGAKYNCKVDPNKEEYGFYLLDNNEDGTSDLIMDANINASGEAVIPNVNSGGEVPWFTSDVHSEITTIQGPQTAMTHLHNATKSWTNVPPLNFEYYDREAQGIDLNNPVIDNGERVGYKSFISTNGIGVITKGDEAETQVTIGSTSEPLRARMPVYSTINESVNELTSKENSPYLYNNLTESWNGSPRGYWTLSSYANYGSYGRHAWYVHFDGRVHTGDGDDTIGTVPGGYDYYEYWGIRAVITVEL